MEEESLELRSIERSKDLKRTSIPYTSDSTIFLLCDKSEDAEGFEVAEEGVGAAALQTQNVHGVTGADPAASSLARQSARRTKSSR